MPRRSKDIEEPVGVPLVKSRPSDALAVRLKPLSSDSDVNATRDHFQGHHDEVLSDSTVNAIRVGDNVVWESLHAKLSGRLQRLAVHRIGNELRVRTSPSDVVQETFLLAHRSASGFRGKSLMEVFAWINSIFSNRIKKAYRDEKDALKRSVRREVSWPEQRREAAMEETEFTPSRIALENEERELIDRAFQALSEDDQLLITDHFIKGVSLREIANRNGKTEVAVRKHWSRALARWRYQTQLLVGDSAFDSI